MDYTVLEAIKHYITDESPEKPSASSVWDFFLDLTEDNIELLSELMHTLFTYGEKDVSFSTSSSPRLDQMIETYLNSSASTEDREKHGFALILAAAHLDQERALKIVSASIEICHKLIEEKKELPIEFIEYFDDFCLDNYSEEGFKALSDLLHREVAGEHKLATLACFSPLIQEYEDVLDEDSGFFRSQALSLLETNDSISLQVAALMIEYSEGIVTSEDAEKIVEKFAPLMNSPNDVMLAKRSSYALRALIVERMIGEEFADTLLGLLPTFGDSPVGLKLYFKVLSELAAPEEDHMDCDCCDDHDHHCHESGISLELAQKLLNFAKKEILSDEQFPLVQGHCYDLLSVLASVDPAYIEDDYMQLLERLVQFSQDEKKQVALLWSSTFVVAARKLFPSETQAKTAQIVPVLLKNFDNEEFGPLKDRMNMFSDVCFLIGDGLCQDLLPKVSEVSIKDLREGSDGKVLSRACACINSLAAVLEKKDREEFLVVAKDKLMTNGKSELDCTIVHTLGEVIDKVLLPAEGIKEIVSYIAEAKLPSQKGKKPHQEIPLNTIYFNFFSKFIEKYPGDSQALVEVILEWMRTIDVGLICPVLSCVKSAIDAACVNEEKAKATASFLEQTISELDILFAEEFGGAVELLTAIYNQYPSAISNVASLIETLSLFVRKCAETEEEDQFHESLFSTLAFIAEFVFGVYANDDEVEIDENLLTALVEMMPFPPTLESQPTLLEHLVEFMQNTERFEAVILPVLKLFTEFLLMKNSEQKEYNLEQGLIKSMKEALKRIVKMKPQIGTRIAKGFGSSRAKVNRFNALLR